MERTLYEHILGHAVQGVAASRWHPSESDELARLAHEITAATIKRMPSTTKPAPPAVLTLREVGPAKYEAVRPDGERFLIVKPKSVSGRWSVSLELRGVPRHRVVDDFQAAIATVKNWEVAA